MGGMGFRDLRVSNQALLAKQMWRLLTNPGTLVGRVMKARYFKHSSVIDARRGHDPSFAWRSLWGAKSLLMEGLMWRIGDGESVRVWEDPWLPGERRERVPLPNIEADPSMCVAAFIDRDTGLWREDVLHALLSEVEVKRVQAIPLSRDLPADSPYWWPSRSGDYTVKTGY
ncbi:putative mitochondrial protein AtMg00310 [Silene latifolia]|uniref:putative mitochondrial protein AtMg00310 n=1 Tax=Silene latifolia TaxID=37657 RepID=UPI003D782E47